MRRLIIHVMLACIGILGYNISGHAQIITTIAGDGGFGYGGDGGPATNATIGFFGCVAIDKHHNIYIADGNNNRIRRVDSASGEMEDWLQQLW